MDHSLTHLAALTALNKVMNQGYFDICTIDKVAKILQVIPEKTSYDTLSVLHCVHYNEMPRVLHESIPKLIIQCLQTPELAESMTIIVPPQPEETPSVFERVIRLIK